MFLDVTKTLAGGFVVSCEIFGLTLAFGIPLGLLVCFGYMNNWAPFKHAALPQGRHTAALRAFRPVSAILGVIIWIVRGTPLLLQLVFVYYGLPIILGYPVFGNSERVEAAILTFTINYACYFAVIFRGGIEGVPRGQTEAGLVLGMTKGQVFFHVTLLQLIKRIMPPMSNEIITLVKDTALARIIAVMEIFYYGYRYVKSEALVWPLFYTGAFFLAFVGGLTILFSFIERRLAYIKIL
ncbi:MAG: amino acid ABC transporter permease [Clostridiales Family XIII bacterium]|jgi:polar amino acid transport system permease protein|nr:amino acid ABC transporter permease [Clostridiales Family XIII bacterium]